MDVLSKNDSINCIRHPNYSALFIKVNEIGNSNQVFYCETCIDEVDSFNPQNFIRINSLLESHKILFQKWPFIEKDNYISSEIEKHQDQQKEVTNFFDDLKKEIFYKIESCQKSMFNISSEILLLNKRILQEFQNQSKLNIFQKILSNQQTDSKEKEQQCRELINKAYCEKQQNSQQVFRLIDEYKLKNHQFNFEISLNTKTSILQMIEQINLFEKKWKGEQDGMDCKNLEQKLIIQKNSIKVLERKIFSISNLFKIF